MNDKVLGRARIPSRVLTSLLLATAVSVASAAPPKLTVGEEPVVDLTTFNYNGVSVSVGPSQGFLLCANTPWQQSSPAPANVRLVPTNPALEFGAVSVAGAPVVLNDVRSFRYQGGTDASVEVNKAAAPGTLGCFITNAAGTRVVSYNGLFVDGFEVAPVNACSSSSSDSCAAIRVASVVADTDFNQVVYTYYIDYHLPAGVANYTLRDGYANLRFGAVASWCATASQSTTTCAGTPNSGRTVDVNLVGSAASATNGRIRIVRRSLTGVTIAQLQQTSGPLVIAALFPEAPARSFERNLADNVSTGTATLSDQAPVFTQIPASFTANETTGMASVNFTISDDTNEVAGSLLRASALVRFGKLGNFQASVSCGSATPLPSQPTRICSVSFVPPARMVNFATAATAVTADIILTATDTLNQSTSTGAIALVVNSTANSAPVFDTSRAPMDLGVPTVVFTCNQSALMSGLGSTDCGLKGAQASFPAFLLNVRPGPIDAQDELALQEAFVETTGVNQISCDNVAIFNGPSPPRINPTTFNFTYTPNGNAGVAICDVVVRDRMIGGGSFPAGQASQSTSMRLRIEVVDDIP